MKNLAFVFFVVILALATILTGCESKQAAKKKSNKIPKEMIGDSAIVASIQSQFLVPEGSEFGRALLFRDEKPEESLASVEAYLAKHHYRDSDVTILPVIITSIVASTNGTDTLFMERKYSEAKSLLLGDKIRIEEKDTLEKVR